jgi:hypothetical protein
MPPHPPADQLGAVHRMPVNNQVHLPPDQLPQQPAQEVDEHRAGQRPENSRNRSSPPSEIALIMFTRNRLPVRLMTGVWPTGAHDCPAAWSERTPSSSSPQHHPTLPLGWGTDGG